MSTAAVPRPTDGTSSGSARLRPRTGSERAPTAPNDTQDESPGTKDKMQTRRGTMDKTSRISDSEWKEMLSRAVQQNQPKAEIEAIWQMKAGTSKNTTFKETDEKFMDETLLDELFTAIERENNPVISTLINLKSTIAARRRYGQTALHFAVQEGNGRAVRELLSHSQIIKAIDATDKSGRTALHEAAKLGLQGMIEDLLSHRADIDALDDEHITPLHVVCLWGTNKYTTLRLLLDNGAEVNTRDEYGECTLYRRCTGLGS